MRRFDCVPRPGTGHQFQNGFQSGRLDPDVRVFQVFPFQKGFPIAPLWVAIIDWTLSLSPHPPTLFLF